MPTFRFKHDTTGKGTKPIARRIDDAGEPLEPKGVEQPITAKANLNPEIPEIAPEEAGQAVLQTSDTQSDAELVASEPSLDTASSTPPDSENDVTLTSDVSTVDVSAELLEGKSASEKTPGMDDAPALENQLESPTDLALNTIDEPAADNPPQDSESTSDLRNDLKDELMNELKDELLNELRSELKEEIRAELKDELKAELKEKLKADLRNKLKNDLKADGQSG